MTERIKPLRVDIKIRNNALVRRREELGLSAPKFAKAAGISYGQYLAYENMECYPIYRDNSMTRALGKSGCWRDGALKIAAFHGVGPDELWPDAVLQLRKVRASIEADPQQLTALAATSRALPPTPDEELESTEARALVNSVILELDPVEQNVLRYRFGFNERMGDKTLQEVGESLDVTRERVREIEARLLKKLRSPAFRKRLEPLLDPGARHRELTELQRRLKFWRDREQKARGYREAVDAGEEIRRIEATLRLLREDAKQP